MVLLLTVVLGAIIAFVGPTLLPQQMRSSLADNVLRVIGVSCNPLRDRVNLVRAGA